MNLLNPEEAANDLRNKLWFLFNVGQRIGNGAYAQVFEATTWVLETPLALKIVYSAATDHCKALHVLREIKYMSILDHQNIMKLRGTYGLRNQPYTGICLVMDLMNCSLWNCIESHAQYFPTHRSKKQCLLQILSGLVYLHSAQICHRDLKPDNILYHAVDESFKITDFNHARKIGADPVNDMTTDVGTYSHRPPELTLRPSRQCSSMDVYAAGLICLEILTNRPRFLHGHTGMEHIENILFYTGTPNDEDLADVDTEEEKVMIRLKAGGRPRTTWYHIIPGLGDSAAELLDNMLHFAPSRRWTAAQAVSSNFLADERPAGWQIPHYDGEELEDYSHAMTLPKIMSMLNNSITVDLSSPAWMILVPE